APARDPGHVRLQERQVAEPDRARAAGRKRLLGAARLRPRRLGRPVERVRGMSVGSTELVEERRRRLGRRRERVQRRRFTRVERALHWANALGFFVLLATGLVLYLPSLA